MNMEKVFKKINGETIVFALLILAIVVLGLIGKTNNDVSVGADTVLPIAGTTYTLAGAGISSTATSFTLTSFTLSQTGTEITDSDMSETFYMTLEPGSRARQEIVSCTTVTQNSDDTATISGCTRGLLPISPYTADTDYAFAHAGGSAVIVSDPPQLFNQTTFKGNDEVITGSWTFPTPLGNSNAATKSYVDGLVTGGEVTNEALVIAGNAGETVATGTLVYFDGTDQEWKKVDTDTSTTYVDKFIGLTQGAGVNAGAISGGILLKGRDTTQTGLTPGSTYYATSTAGEIDTNSNGIPIGEAEDTTTLYFDPVAVNGAYLSRDNTFSGNNTFSGTNTFTTGITGHASTSLHVYTSNDTWTKPSGFEYIIVEIVGGGGGGYNNQDGSGAGGGGYSRELLTAADLTATTSVAVTVGAGGSVASSGGTSSFGNFLSATGGSGASIGDNGASGGGTGSGGDINFSGGFGTDSVDYNLSDGTVKVGKGGVSYFGQGTNSGGGGNGNAAGNAGIVIITVYY